MITIERVANMVAERVNPLHKPDFVKPVCIVKGSPYEMGYQYAQQIESHLLTEMMYALSRLMMRRTDPHIFANAHEFERVLANKSPEMIEMMHGMADRLKLPYEAVLIYMVEIDLTDPLQPNEQGNLCSTISAWGSATADGRLLTAVNSDGPYFATNSFKPTMVLFDEAKGKSLVTNGGFLSNFVMNDQGLVVMASFGGGVCGKGDKGLGIPAVISTFLTGWNAASAAEAEAYYLADGRSNSENLHITDGSDNSCIVETTAGHHFVRRPGDFGEKDYLLATNYFLTDEMQSSMGEEETPLSLNAKSRYRTEDKMLKDLHGAITLKDLDDIISCDSYFDGEEWHRNVWDEVKSNWTPEHRSHTGSTYMQCLGDPEQRVIYVRQGQRCRTVSPIPDATGQYSRIKLAQTPLDTVKEAEADAKLALWQLAKTMETQNIASVSAEDALTQIKSWVWEGSGLMQFGNLHSAAEDTLASYARAVTLFSKAQVLARKWNHSLSGDAMI